MATFDEGGTAAVEVATLFLFFLGAEVTFEDVIVVAVGLPAAVVVVVVVVVVVAAAAAVALTSASISAPGSKRTGSLREREAERLLTLVVVLLDNMVEID